MTPGSYCRTSMLMRRSRPFSGGCSWSTARAASRSSACWCMKAAMTKWPRRCGNLPASKSWEMDSIPPPRSGPSKIGRSFCGFRRLGRPFKRMASLFYIGEEIEGKGNFFPVTILDNPSPHADYVKLENFGPLRSLIKYSSIDEAIEIANSTDYGLGGSVWGRDRAALDAVAHRMEAGTIWINQHLVLNPNVPFGGNKDSGFGVQYGAEGLKEYCYLRVISAKT